jgi:hypothetical protein
MNFKPKKQLYKKPAPIWLNDLQSLDAIPVKELLTDSVFYPASGNDWQPIQAFSGFSHSFIYIDPVIKDWDIPAIDGYQQLFSRKIRSGELCASSFDRIQPTEMDGNLKHLQNLFSNPFSNAENVVGIWSIYEKAPTSNWGNPNRISVLLISAEGTEAYQALYYSNRIKPALIFMVACVWGNWTEFEKRGGFFNRVVMSNPAGHPDFLVSQDRDRQIWDGYSRKIESKRWMPIWIADDIDLGDLYLDKSNQQNPYSKGIFR